MTISIKQIVAAHGLCLFAKSSDQHIAEPTFGESGACWDWNRYSNAISVTGKSLDELIGPKRRGNLSKWSQS